MYVVNLSRGKSFPADAERNLLECARSHGVVLPYSCKSGRCGVCKARVESGETVATHPELSLTPEEMATDHILTCCRRAASSIVLDVEDLSDFPPHPIRTLPCRIDAVEQLKDDVVCVTLRTPPSNRLEYYPGQYVDVIGKGGLRRSYSLASAPRPDGKLELQIRSVPGGKLSQYWFRDAVPNDLLYLEGPFGTFMMRPSEHRHVVFLATGTGIAPVKAMLEQLEQNPTLAQQKTIEVFWGGRTPEDYYWTPRFINIPVRFVPTLSRARWDWTGDTGYVQDAMLREERDVTRTVVYACGSEAMISSARARLLAAGFQSRDFHADAFVSSGL